MIDWDAAPVPALPLGALASALVVQRTEYRWAGIVSEANRERMQFTLHSAFQGIRAELNDRFVKPAAFISGSGHDVYVVCGRA